MLVSPSESETARALGTSTWRTEEWGVDFAWVARGSWYGVQRKALTDLLASVDDGRLAAERMQMQSLHHAFLILETGERGGGMPREMPSTALAAVNFGRPWTGPQLRGVLYGLMADGIQVMTTKDEAETLARIVELEAWSKKDRHGSARGRPAAPPDVFGRLGHREYAVHLMTSLPSVGVEMAGRIYDHLGLIFSLREDVTVERLMEVKGVGKVTAQRIVDVYRVKE